MKSIHGLPDAGAAAPVRGRRVPDLRHRILAGRRVGLSDLSRLAVRSVVVLLLVVVAVATFVTFAPTAVVYLGIALVILALPIVVPYLVIRGMVAVVDR